MTEIKRQANGQFARGGAGGPGRPPRATEQSYLTALRDEVSLEDWGAIVRTAVEAAKSGDDKARSWLGKMLLGDGRVTAEAFVAEPIIVELPANGRDPDLV